MPISRNAFENSVERLRRPETHPGEHDLAAKAILSIYKYIEKLAAEYVELERQLDLEKMGAQRTAELLTKKLEMAESNLKRAEEELTKAQPMANLGREMAAAFAAFQNHTETVRPPDQPQPRPAKPESYGKAPRPSVGRYRNGKWRARLGSDHVGYFETEAAAWAHLNQRNQSPPASN